MTEPAQRARRRGPRLAPFAAGSAALVLVVFVLLAQRVAAGTDPVLGAPRLAMKRPVIVRRVVKRVIVETTVHRKGHGGPAKTSESSSPAVVSQPVEEAPAPVTRSS